MAALAHPVLAMLGPGPGVRTSIAEVVGTYRAHGLFARWPIEYVATTQPGSAPRQALAALQGGARLAALFARHRRLVVHVHTEANAAFWRDAAYMEAAIAARCPLIVQLHGAGFERLFDASGTPGRRLIRHVLEHAACVVAPSQGMATRLRGVSPAVRAVFLPTPVAVAPLQAGATRANLILFLGRLQAEKGAFDLLEALARVRAAVPDVRLVCAGEGEREALARHAEALGISELVKFTSWVGPSGKRALLEAAAVYARPSYAEGLPLSLLEAMAAGLPVVASPVGAVPEVVVDGASGFLVAPGDVASLERLLRKLLLERELAARVGAAAHETARMRFAAERAVPKLEALYESVGLAPAGIKPSPWPASQAG